jgi:hypothetical protein
MNLDKFFKRGSISKSELFKVIHSTIQKEINQIDGYSSGLGFNPNLFFLVFDDFINKPFYKNDKKYYLVPKEVKKDGKIIGIEFDKSLRGIIPQRILKSIEVFSMFSVNSRIHKILGDEIYKKLFIESPNHFVMYADELRIGPKLRVPLNPNGNTKNQFQCFLPEISRQLYKYDYKQEGILLHLVEVNCMKLKRARFFYLLQDREKNWSLSCILNNPFFKDNERKIELQDIINVLLEQEFNGVSELKRKYKLSNEEFAKFLEMSKDEFMIKSHGVIQILNKLSEKIWTKKEEYLKFALTFETKYEKLMNYLNS